jgi:hypothetical protein
MAEKPAVSYQPKKSELAASTPARVTTGASDKTRKCTRKAVATFVA